MAAPLTAKRLSFDCYQADLSAGELFKHGVRIRLRPQAFKILEMLLERPGEILTREEIRSALWDSETFVDFDHGLSSAINRIREALNDSVEQPKYIETIPKRGYRFLGQVRRAEGPVKVVASQDPYELTREVRADSIPAAEATRESSRSKFRIGFGVAAESRRSNWLRFGLAVGAVAIAAVLGTLIALRFLQHENPIAASAPTVVPFTTMPGQQTEPAFSPDGSRIAFAWKTPGATGFDLYVKAIGSESLLRLTEHPSDWLSPAWSPDGTQIAFHRVGGADTGVYLVPALGGPERKLRATHVPYAVAAPISWSPDGKSIGFGDVDQGGDRIFVLSVETLRAVQIPHNPRCLNEAMPTFSHRGDRLAYVCVLALPKLELFTVDLPNGEPKRIAPFENVAPGLAWSSDDRSIVVARGTDDDRVELDEFSTSDGALRILDFAQNGAWPSISPDGNTLAYTTEFDRANIWRADLRHPASPPVELAPSTRLQQNAIFSPDGKHVAFNSNRSGAREVWMSDTDGGNLVQMSKLHGDAWAPRFSPDGHSIAFGAHVGDQYGIYIEDVLERVPRKFATNMKEVFFPNWSRDGKWIYFIGRISPRNRIYRCPASGGDAVPVTSGNDDTDPWESVDQNTLYFVSLPEEARVRMRPLNSSASETAVTGVPKLRDATLWTVASGGIYYVPARSPKEIFFFDFSRRTSRKVFEIRGEFSEGLSVSSDGRWLLYSQAEDVHSSIMLAEHFH
jgi:Tol biopolymer transport system component/DNA-binding winged helix-turn-helix (wHTH) protein